MRDDIDVLKRETAEMGWAVDAFSEPHLTDLGNSKRFVQRYGAAIRYVPSWGWLAWDGKRWKRDALGDVYHMAKETVLNLHLMSFLLENDEERRKLRQHALRSENEARITAVISLAQSEQKIVASPEAFDRDPFLFNIENGTVDLRTGEIKPHNPGDLITRIASVTYNQDAACPRWETFLMEVFDNDVGLIKFIHRAVGYSLTGATNEQCLFMLHGSGSNGKSSFIETMKLLMGEYAATADFSTFLIQGRDGIRNDIAGLAGSRFVTSIEVDEGRRLAESLIKQVSGGDTVTARFLHREFFEFRPIFKLWMAANHKPIVKGRDYAIWRRIKLIPFNVVFTEDRRDKRLIEKLQGELPGILNWAVGGCLLWQLNGLNPPEAVKSATEDYRNEMDTIKNFINECCEMYPGAQEGAGGLYRVYREWAGRGAVSQTKFGITLSEAGYEKIILQGRKFYRGICLMTGEGR